jgi:hypothetical protein
VIGNLCIGIRSSNDKEQKIVIFVKAPMYVSSPDCQRFLV